MEEDQHFAYSLSQVEQGWTWSLWDEDGGVVAAGAAPDQPSAHRRLLEAIEQTRNSAARERRATGPKEARGRPAPSVQPSRRKSSRLAGRRLDGGLFAAP